MRGAYQRSIHSPTKGNRCETQYGIGLYTILWKTIERIMTSFNTKSSIILLCRHSKYAKCNDRNEKYETVAISDEIFRMTCYHMIKMHSFIYAFNNELPV